MLTSVGPVLGTAAVLYTLVEGFVPNLTLVAMGLVTGAIPAAVRSGLGSPAGHPLEARLAVAGACYAVSLLRGPVEGVLTAAVQARIAVSLQRRLVEAVSLPPGIAHLEDPVVLDRLASAQGTLTSSAPASAPMMLLGRVGDRLSGVLACAVLATFRWWVGLVVLVMWLVVRRPVRQRVVSRVATFRGSAEPVRRSWYLLGLSWRPAAAKEIRLFGIGDWLVDNHVRTYTEALEPFWARVARLDRVVAALSVLVLVTYGATAGILGWAAYQHRISLGTLVVMLTMLPASMQVGSLSATDMILEATLGAFPDVDAITAELDRPATPVDQGLPAAGLPRREIRFEAVSFRYPDADHDVLCGLDLELRSGRSTAVVGANGAGKTTLVTLLARLRDPTAGRIVVDGVPLQRLRPDEWQRQVAAVFQDFTRLPLTARENVALGLLGEPVDPVALDRAADLAGLGDLLDRLPAGWDTVLSERYEGGQDLSGGQWQRIALARALYAVERGARILVLDEPTAHLDVRAEAAFYDRFLEITSDRATSLVISHRFSTVRRADQIAVLDGGRITELGTHSELLRAGGTYARLFTAQVDRFAAGAGRPARRQRA